jgi:predicted MFS family arabinose efflux permease
VTGTTTTTDVPAHLDSRRAWRVAAGAGIASGTAFGSAYTFGPFSDAMAEDFGSGRGPTALVFGITLLLVPFAESLIDANGWRSAYLRLALVDVVLFAVAALLIARPPGLVAPPPAIDHMKAIMRIDAFRIMFATGLLFSISLFIAFAFIVDFATEEGIASDRAALLVGIIGATSIIGRLGITSLSGRLSSVRLLQGCLAAQPVAFLLWLLSDGSYPVLVAFAVTMGIAYGGFVALGPEVAAVLFGTVGLGSTIGLTFLGAGLGGLLGPTTAGFLADASDGQVVPIVFALTASVLTVLLASRLPTRQVVNPSDLAGAGGPDTRRAPANRP